ncbi:MAG: hypothetical protein E7Y34_02415, partial [Mycoplasma sp.]|nr:hypothetical protein [Mycoplasma sp.]
MNIAFARPPYQRQAINHFVPSIYYATLEIAHSRGRRFYTWLSWLNRYFLGLFQEVSNNDEWKAFNRHFFEVLINNGDVFVSYNKGIFYLWEVKRIYYNGAQVVAIDATLFQPDGDLEKDAKIYTFLNNIHGVYVNFIDRHYKGLIFNWSDHIDTFIMLENNFLNSARFDTKKYELHYLGNDEIELEQYISRITNSADPFIRIITDLDADNP